MYTHMYIIAVMLFLVCIQLQKPKHYTVSDSQKMLKRLLCKYEFSKKLVIPPYNPRYHLIA